MPHQSKVATCCYCGSRAALILAGTVRHELACATCGAPLHELKALRSDAGGKRQTTRRSAPHPMALPAGAAGAAAVAAGAMRRAKPKRKKKRKSLGRKVLSEAFDLFDDLFD
ncbi:hypothetical protein DXV76_08235 [Rhodobacteraceae bacterium CCMM004]|nr:hypothetical protein DXV76_08235 [Rhodobacteraceae bacterium CCMM004]